jgi:hypothetical protein
MTIDTGNDAFLAAADTRYQRGQPIRDAEFPFELETALTVGGIDVTGAVMTATARVHGDSAGWWEVDEIVVHCWRGLDHAELVLTSSDETDPLWRGMLYRLLMGEVRASAAMIKAKLDDQFKDG